MTPDDVLPEFDQEMGKTREALSRIPDGSFGQKPHEKSWTLGELATHIANVPVWLTMTMGTRELDLSQPMESPPVPESTAELVERFDQNRKAAREALEKASAEALAEPWSLRAGEEVMFTLPRAAVVRTMILNHMIHHRGQLTVYLRMAGAVVPGLYGPSADEQG